MHSSKPAKCETLWNPLPIFCDDLVLETSLSTRTASRILSRGGLARAQSDERPWIRSWFSRMAIIWGETPKWMVYKGKTHMDDLGVSLVQETSIFSDQLTCQDIEWLHLWSNIQETNVLSSTESHDPKSRFMRMRLRLRLMRMMFYHHAVDLRRKNMAFPVSCTCSRKIVATPGQVWRSVALANQYCQYPEIGFPK